MVKVFCGTVIGVWLLFFAAFLMWVSIRLAGL